MALSTDARPGDPIVADYLGFLRRRWLVVVVLILVGLALGLAADKVLHKTYKATAAVEVLPLAGSGSASSNTRNTTGSSVNPDTEAQVVKSVSVATAAKALLRVSTPVNTLLSKVTVTVPANSTILDISFSGRHPLVAQSGAQAFATAYLSTRAATARGQLNGQEKVLTTEISALNGQLRAVTQAIGAAIPGSSILPYDRAQQALLIAHIKSLTNQYTAMAATSVDPGYLISAATAPTKASSPRLTYMVAGGLAAGLLVGLIIAAAAEMRDRRLHGSRDAERRSGLSVVAEASLTGRGGWSELLNWRTAAGRAMGEVSNNVSAALGDAPGTVLVVPVSPGAAGGAVAAGLAVALARTDDTTLLVCAGSPDSPVSGMLDVANAPGLREALRSGGASAPAPQHSLHRSGLRVIAPGVVLDDDDEEMAHPRQVLDLVARSREAAASVVIEAPPVASSPLAQGLASGAETIVLVAVNNRTHRGDLQHAVRELDLVGAHVLGIVLVSGKVHHYRPTHAPSRAGGSETAPMNVTVVDENAELDSMPVDEPVAGSAAPSGHEPGRVEEPDVSATTSTGP